MRVAVLAGGRSSEHDVSLASAAAVRDGLRQAGHEVVDVLLERDGGWSCDGAPLALHPGSGLLRADAVFPVLHGPFGEDGSVQGLLELLDVPYVGAGVLASALCMDKVAFKDVMRAHDVAQVDYDAVHEGEPVRLEPPVFVKPARLGSSVGISKATTADELQASLATAFEHDPLVIVEAMSGGMEVECAVLGNDDPLASQPGEIVIQADWYDYEAKYTPGGMDLVTPPRLDDAVQAQVRELAVRVFRLAGCAGLARVDFFVEDGERVLVNELNTMPGFTETSVYPKLFEASGVPFPELVDRLVALGVERHADEGRYRF
ncbi:MAG: D-alanine-D-alanine ligase [Frankiaceae bacterium]|jgi:D-alanine-D-alanine ligase|nr:D-alanine-D-alanine ligase [Frankiaceae bacterium]